MKLFLSFLINIIVVSYCSAQFLEASKNSNGNNAPNPVLYGGYYSNVNYDFSQPWYINFENDVIIEIVAPEGGVFEIRSATIEPNSEIWLTLGSANGLRIDNPVDADIYSPSLKVKQFYLTDAQVDQNNNRVFVHIEKQDNHLQPHVVVAHHFFDSQYNLSESLGVIEQTDFRMYVESYRRNLLWEIEGIQAEVNSKLLAIQMQDSVLSALSLPLEFNEVTKQYSYATGQVDDQMLFDALRLLMFTVVDFEDTVIDDLVEGLVDVGFAVSDLKKGNIVPTLQILITKGREAGVLLNGISDLYIQQEKIDALILSEVVLRDSLNNLLPVYTDEDLLDLADKFAPQLNINFGCQDFLFFNCFFGNYDQQKFLLTYRTMEELFLQRISNYQDFGGKYVDVDFDGFTNDEELAEGGDPNDPFDVPQSALNRCPIASISLNNNSVEVGEQVNTSATSIDLDTDSLDHTWILYKPNGSNSTLTSSSATSTSFTPDREGSYTLSLSSSDNYCTSETTTTISAEIQYTPDDLSALDDDTLYLQYEDSIGLCELIHLEFDGEDYVTVPQDQIWRKITMAGSRQDIVLLMNEGSRPERDNPPGFDCENGFAQNFDADFQIDFDNSNQIEDWNDDHFGGDRIYVALFSYDGRSSVIPLLGEIRIDIDLDGDQVPDDNEDPACVNDPNEQFDTDSDGVCNNSDDFRNDPAASVDTDQDGYPNSWNTGQGPGSSTTGLTLDAFPTDPTEWTDSDNDGVGDNTDMLPDNPLASIDTDGDGFPDAFHQLRGSSQLYIDAFPTDLAASLDTDSDGYPDAWNPGRNQSDSTTGLILDQLPNDPLNHIDTDGDGIGDNTDLFPNDESEWLDSDMDGTGDNSDAAPLDPDRQTNNPPVINIEQVKTFVAGTVYELIPAISDPDLDPVNITMPSGTALDFVSFENGIIFISPLPDVHEGTHYIIIKAEDSLGSETILNFTFTVLRQFSISIHQEGIGTYRLLFDNEVLPCNETCNISSFEGANHILEVIVEGFNEFVGWSGDCSGTDICKLNVNEHKDIGIRLNNTDTVFLNGFE
ncbi:hypothetical protein [Marinicella sp. W31]|uniref:hypothetical protein n=1 Tax=Marinicella sp. W31 TaxID=3023713 RepID=UPI0037564B1F